MLFQFLLVRLLAFARLIALYFFVFQFLLVRLLELIIKDFTSGIILFQFLLVRLLVRLFPHLFCFYPVSIPFGSIISDEAVRGKALAVLFQFLLVRLLDVKNQAYQKKEMKFQFLLVRLLVCAIAYTRC